MKLKNNMKNNYKIAALATSLGLMTVAISETAHTNNRTEVIRNDDATPTEIKTKIISEGISDRVKVNTSPNVPHSPVVRRIIEIDGQTFGYDSYESDTGIHIKPSEPNTECLYFDGDPSTPWETQNCPHTMFLRYIEEN